MHGNTASTLSVNQEQLYAYALSHIPGVGYLTARSLWQYAGSCTALFTQADLPAGLPRPIRDKLLPYLHNTAYLREAEQTLAEAESAGVRLVSVAEEAYPYRLRECPDAPLLLFTTGSPQVLQQEHIVAVVGTRKADRYGRETTYKLIRELHDLVPHLVIVSGLAYGVDIAAHKAALELGIPTVAVLGHGLDRIYPAAHRATAIEMLDKGALLTEYPFRSTPDRFHFVQRNRITAGLCDLVLVVQSAHRGGSLITAHIANSYSRLVAAVPGRISDELSGGCNRLIADQVAFSALSGADIAVQAEWLTPQEGLFSRREAQAEREQKKLPEGLSEPATRIMALLLRDGGCTVDALCRELGLEVSDVSFELFTLENLDLVEAAPGGVFISKV